jgi:glycosyltransferase involved in cell wall biosynthesis
VVTVRGGPELEVDRLRKDCADRIAEVFANCDQLIADCEQNYELAVQLGLARRAVSPLGAVPGTGGVDVDALTDRWRLLPSERERLILCPKAYEGRQSKVLPVYESLQSCWDEIGPCRIQMLAANDEALDWYRALPDHIRQSCHIRRRVRREEVLELMTQARVMLAPSLVDGVPNVLYEAMACGAFPVVSPLATIRTVVKDRENVLFARNLYSGEIAERLRTAMADDALVDAAAQRNVERVKEFADRRAIRSRVIRYYEELAERQEAEQ